MGATSPRTVTSNCALADDPLGLTGIFAPEIQLAQWRRLADPLIAGYLDASLSDLRQRLASTIETGRKPESFPLTPWHRS